MLNFHSQAPSEEEDVFQTFTNELNKRQIMPLELMQARSHPKFAETADRVVREMRHLHQVVLKTAMYIKERQGEIEKTIEEFTDELGIKLEPDASPAPEEDSRKRSMDSECSSKSEPRSSSKRVKHGISDILASSEVKEEVQTLSQQNAAQPPAVFQLQQNIQQNLYFNRLQQQAHEQMVSNQYHQYTQAQQQQQVAPNQVQIPPGLRPGMPGQNQPVNRYWSDAMYSILLRAQQNQIKEKTPGMDGRVPSHQSDSGHESGNGDSSSEHEAIVDPNAVPAVEAPAPTHQIKPQWIIKRMEKLKRKRAARENGEFDIDVEGDVEEDEDDLPQVESLEIEPDAEIGPAQYTGVGTGVITKDQNGKTQITCKQCRWTLRKWESWAKKRNAGNLPGLSIKSDTNDPAPQDFLTLDNTEDLVKWMSQFIREIRKDSGEAYQIDSITAFAFSLQKVLKETGRQVDILRNEKFVVFLEAMNDAMDCSVKTVVIQPTPRSDEETLWQSGELGYHSPEALTQTLVMIIVKHLKIRSSQAHRDMEMSDFEKVKIFNPSNPTQLLEIYRYKDSRGNAKRGEIVPNLAKPERCPVRILDYYLEKRPPAIRHSGPFYLWPSDQKTIDRMSWFRVKPLSKKYLLKCLCRIKQTNLHDF
ncbi:unnamed protein product [Oikopleura dioica]|uniref:Uncharacterized protein n=1 Tax=Oikopleura dioica TaxID=34765 RepID=E4X0E5_OIKDI|nr:unnamed protein product [Oikopleura dioica]